MKERKKERKNERKKKRKKKKERETTSLKKGNKCFSWDESEKNQRRRQKLDH